MLCTSKQKTAVLAPHHPDGDPAGGHPNKDAAQVEGRGRSGGGSIMIDLELTHGPGVGAHRRAPSSHRVDRGSAPVTGEHPLNEELAES